MGSTHSTKKKVLYPHPIVETEYGLVEGMNVVIPKDPQKRIAKVFLGIPFAKPPLNELRFEKPQRPDKWKGKLKCQRYRSPAIQKVLPWLSPHHGSEDCLYLNIVAPAWKSSDPNGFPVMFYIHGGGFVMDSAANYKYSKICRMLTRHGVIIVTTQYRLGLLGYLCTNDETSLGNYGLWDQYFALKFTADNIAQFGGNPSNITVFGQSAGAVSSDLLSISPLSQHLISKVICLGGNCEAMWAVSARPVAAEFCQNLAIKLGYKRRYTGPWTTKENERMIKFLKNLPPEKFAMTMVGCKTVFEKMRLEVSPVVDGEILPAPPYILRQTAPTRPVISGITESEGLIFLSLSQKIINDKMIKEFEETFEGLLEILSKFEMDEEETEALTIEKFQKIYGITELSKRDKIFLKKTMIYVMSDIINNYAWYNFMKVERERGSQVWSFIFQHHNPKMLEGLRLMLPMNTATHGTEIVYIFDHNMFKVPFRRTKLDHSVGLEMTTLLTNFAKYGNPNGDPDLPETFIYDDFVWESVTSECSQRHLIVSTESKMNEEVLRKSLVKFSPYYQKLTQYFCDDKFWNNKSDTE